MPLKQYETTLIWSGNNCFNPVEKTGRCIFASLQMEEIEYPFHLSSVDSIETVQYKLYSVEPLMWSENDDLFIEKKQPQKTKPKPKPVLIEKDPAEHYRSLLAKFVKTKSVE